MINKVVSLDEAMAVVRDGDTVCVSGFVGTGTPECLIKGLERQFELTGHPRDLTLVFAAAPGDGKDQGLNRLAKKGLVRRAIGGHWSLVPKLGKMAVEGEIEAYNLPLGCISQLYRDIAAGKPGLMTKVGLNTFVDPRLEGGKINAISKDDLVKLIYIDGEEWLMYKAFPINVAFIRGTTADTKGNITMEREALTLDVLPTAMAAKNSKGLVIAQVERIAMEGTLKPKQVAVPGTLVDCVIVSEPGEHRQTYATAYQHAFSGEIRVPVEGMAPMGMSERKVIARRAAFELPVNGIVNLGIGMPEGVSEVANEERITSFITLTAEAGIIGGVPQSGLDFGAAVNADCIVQTNQQFDFYDGGGLDLACLGMAETDAFGNVNVSRFGPRLAGSGGFINISQNTRKVIFVGTFTAGGLQVSVENGVVRILKEGKVRKFVDKVEQITFSGAYAAERGQEVLYVTERCVFRLTKDGLELSELAPGIDVERDILPHMGFRPIVNDPQPMDPRIFRTARMGLKEQLLSVRTKQRIYYDAKRNILFANHEGLEVKTPRDVSRIRQRVEEICEGLNGKKVDMVANYDGLYIDPAVSDQYADMISELEAKYYRSAARYTTSAFMRLKLGAQLSERAVAPHIFETGQEADRFVRQTGK